MQVIATAGMKSLAPDVEMPEEGCENYDSLKTQAEQENESIKLKNEALSKLKAKIGFEFVDRLPEREPVLDEENNVMDPQPEEELKRPRDPQDWGFWQEKCYINIRQWRDPEGTVVEEVPKANDRRAQLAAQQKAAEEAKRQAALAELGEGEEPPFELERVPARCPVLQAINPASDINMVVHHSGKYSPKKTVNLNSVVNFLFFNFCRGCIIYPQVHH